MFYRLTFLLFKHMCCEFLSRNWIVTWRAKLLATKIYAVSINPSSKYSIRFFIAFLIFNPFLRKSQRIILQLIMMSFGFQMTVSSCKAVRLALVQIFPLIDSLKEDP